MTIGTTASATEIEGLLPPDSSLAVQPSINASLRSRFPDGDQLFQVTSGGCSCDLVIRSDERSLDEQRSRQHAKYQKKGWSAAKIERALGDWQRTHEQRTQRHAAPRVQLLSLVRKLALNTGSLRVLVHFYSGAFDTELVRGDDRTQMPLDRLEDIGAIGEDRLVDIVARLD